MASLERNLRKDLGKTVKSARRVAEAGARTRRSLDEDQYRVLQGCCGCGVQVLGGIMSHRRHFRLVFRSGADFWAHQQQKGGEIGEARSAS